MIWSHYSSSIRWFILIYNITLYMIITLLIYYPWYYPLRVSYNIISYYDIIYIKDRITAYTWYHTDIVYPSVPEHLIYSVYIILFIDADHTDNNITMWLHMDILIYVNLLHIIWVSKYQNIAKSSTFGFDFIALKHACEDMHGLRDRLILICIPLDGSTRILCDNDVEIKNWSFPESGMDKIH